jgi:hypothetical protein
MKRFATSIAIGAPPERIWPLLTDAGDYPRWNSTVTKLEGRIAKDETIKLFVKINPGRAFPVKVSVFEAPRRMVWSGGMPLGLFTGERTFTLTPNGDGTTQFSMVEEFSGLLAPLIGRSIPDLQPAFDEFAAALRREAER